MVVKLAHSDITKVKILKCHEKKQKKNNGVFIPNAIVNGVLSEPFTCFTGSCWVFFYSYNQFSLIDFNEFVWFFFF